jgi:hypothetical protein
MSLDEILARTAAEMNADVPARKSLACPAHGADHLASS